SEPDWKRLPADTPPGIRKLLQLCLQKDLQKRRSNAADVRIDIEQAISEPVRAIPASESARSSRLAWIVAALAGLGMIALAIVLWLHVRDTPVEQRVHLSVPLPGNAVPNFFALSPDGRSLAMNYQGGLGIRSFESG